MFEEEKTLENAYWVYGFWHWVATYYNWPNPPAIDCPSCGEKFEVHGGTDRDE